MPLRWIAGHLMFYFLVLFLEMWLTGATSLQGTALAQVQHLMQPALTTDVDVITNIANTLAGCGAGLVLFVNSLFCWSDAVWQGYVFYFWLFLIVPESVALQVGLLFAIRGTPCS